jgi:hypothetical protein
VQVQHASQHGVLPNTAARPSPINGSATTAAPNDACSAASRGRVTCGCRCVIAAGQLKETLPARARCCLLWAHPPTLRAQLKRQLCAEVQQVQCTVRRPTALLGNAPKRVPNETPFSFVLGPGLTCSHLAHVVAVGAATPEAVGGASSVHGLPAKLQLASGGDAAVQYCTVL